MVLSTPTSAKVESIPLNFDEFSPPSSSPRPASRPRQTCLAEPPTRAPGSIRRVTSVATVRVTSAHAQRRGVADARAARPRHSTCCSWSSAWSASLCCCFPQLQAAPVLPAYDVPPAGESHRARAAHRRAARRRPGRSADLRRPRPRSLPGPPAARDSSTWRAVAVVSSVAAAGVHAAVFPHHLEEAGARRRSSSSCVTLAQAAWACLVCLDATRDRLLLAGIVGNLGLVALWAVSRTVGLPVRSRARGRGRLGPRVPRPGSWSSWPPAVVGLRRPSGADEHWSMGDLGPTAWAWAALSGVALARADPDGLPTLTDDEGELLCGGCWGRSATPSSRLPTS